MKLCYLEHTQHKVTCKYITPFNITFSMIIVFLSVPISLQWNQFNRNLYLNFNFFAMIPVAKGHDFLKNLKLIPFYL